jgi:hypothetical protein
MITSLVKSTVRYSTAGVRFATRSGLRLTRALAGMAFKPPQRERDLEPEPEVSEPPARAPRARVAETTPPAAEPSDPGVPGRDTPPARPEDPHHELNVPVGEPDPTEWPDPYDHRPDPRDPDADDEIAVGNVPHTPPGATSTSSPHPSQDPEAEPWEGPKRDKLDE